MDTKRRYVRLMHRLALGVLALGLAASAAVYVTTSAVTEERLGATAATTANDPAPTPSRARPTAGAALAAEVSEWLHRQWQEERRAGTLAFLSIGIALFCWLAARFPPLDD